MKIQEKYLYGSQAHIDLAVQAMSDMLSNTSMDISDHPEVLAAKSFAIAEAMLGQIHAL
jgi:hypothetical protein